MLVNHQLTVGDVDKKTGGMKRRPRTNNPYNIDKEALKAYIKSHPDAYLNEIATHFNVTESGVKKVLKRLNITRKKSLNVIENETKSSA